MLIATPSTTVRPKFALDLRRGELPCGCGSQRASINGTDLNCSKRGTPVSIHPSRLKYAQVTAR